MMDEARETQKKYGSIAITIAIVVGGVLIFNGYPPAGKGFILGTLFSILNFVLMAQSLSYRMNGGKRRAFFAALGSILFRYALIAIPVIMAIKLETFNLIAVISGIFLVQLIIVSDHVKSHIVTMRKKHV